MFAYNDGLLGTPDSIGNYNATLNAYKYYCDDLDADDQLDAVILENRGMFTAGKKNIRHYSIDMGPGLIFNYAVDACWAYPLGGAPWTAPDDFPAQANRPEAWRVDVTETNNTLYNDGAASGGELGLSIDVYDWYSPELNSVKVECPGSFGYVVSDTVSGSGPGYATYDLAILNATPAEGSIDILISVESEQADYGGLLPGKTVTAYFVYTAVVSEEPPNIVYVDDSNTSGVEDGSMAHPYNTIQEGIDAAPVDFFILVDDSGSAYNEQVEMKSDIIMQSQNWDDSDGTGRAFIDGPDVQDAYSVDFQNASNSTITGFQIGMTGDPNLAFYMDMMVVNLGSDILIEDCLFSGVTDVYAVRCINASGCDNLEIANCRFADIDKDTDDSGAEYIYSIYADSCPGLLIRNNIVTDLRLTSDTGMKNIDTFRCNVCNNVVVKNNLVYNLVPQAPGNSNMQKVVYITNSTGASVINNTVDKIDVSVAFFINQDFGYWFEYCGDVEFTNNIATSIYSSGFPPPLARGVCAYYDSYVTADYTDTWDIGPGLTMGTNYHFGGGGISVPGVGAIDADPQYIDPGNENHDFPVTSLCQQGDPSFVDWDDTGAPSNDPLDTDTNTRSRMGCFGGPGGEHVGLLT